MMERNDEDKYEEERLAFREMRESERKTEIESERTVLGVVEKQLKHHLEQLELEEVALTRMITEEMNNE
eukprot:m.25569 g.25569  ORF g.25569 m.25569 type:complete len:69 (-) comp9192_c0_seq2:399-605(-)